MKHYNYFMSSNYSSCYFPVEAKVALCVLDTGFLADDGYRCFSSPLRIAACDKTARIALRHT